MVTGNGKFWEAKKKNEKGEVKRAREELGMGMRNHERGLKGGH